MHVYKSFKWLRIWAPEQDSVFSQASYENLPKKDGRGASELVLRIFIAFKGPVSQRKKNVCKLWPSGVD